jgi:hypothetical protein
MLLFKECEDEVKTGVFFTRYRVIDIKDEEFELFVEGLG